MKILVTGGGGMLGSHLKNELPKNSLFPNKATLNLTNYSETLEYLVEHKPTHIVHAAAKVGGISSNIKYPCDFFEENILINTNIVKAARIAKIPNLLGILSTCIFPDQCAEYPMTEEMLHNGPPSPTNFSYGYAKRCLDVHIRASNKQYDTKYNSLIPCNLYSEFDRTEDNNKMHFVTALIKKIIDAEKNGETKIVLFGTGKPRRQFMYAGDLAKIIKTVVENNIKEDFCVAPDNHNFTIHFMATKIISILNKKIDISYDSSKPDGQFRKDVSNEKMKKFIPSFNFTKFEDVIERIYANYANR